MLSFFQSNAKRASEPPKEISKYDGCEVEFHPLANKYYPKYKDSYIYRELSYWGTCLFSCVASWGQTEAEAMALLDSFLETRGIGATKRPAAEIAKELAEKTL